MGLEQIHGRSKTYRAGGAIAQWLRVRLSGGKLAIAGATDGDYLGWIEEAAFADLDVRSVALRGLEGTVTAVASGAISAGAAAYAASGGKCASSGTVFLGINGGTVATTADGDLFELLPAVAVVSRGQLVQEDLASYPLRLEDFKTWDAREVTLPSTAATDDLAIITGTAGTDAPQLEGIDAGATTEVQIGAVQVAVPVEYVDGETINVVVNAKMKTTVSDDTATLDLQAYRNAAKTVDINSTAATTINDTAAADVTFVLTPTNVVSGDLIDLIFTTAVTDAGNAAGGITAVIVRVTLQCDIKG